MFESSQIIKERYQLQKPLGRTAAGRKTWLAKDLESNEQIIIKLLAFSPEMQWEELKLFEREAEVLQSLNHPRIPKYRDYFSLEREEGGGLPWFALVQDYIPGSSFQELLESGKRFGELKVEKVAAEVLEILIYLHQLSPPVLHRDIKPSNLILGEDEGIYLVDFGAVQSQAAVTGVTFTVVGTSGYSPLEQFWGRAVAASDLYALGATLIHLLTGVAPASLPHQDGKIQFSDRVSIDSFLIRWLEKMTEITIEKRFPTAKKALYSLEDRELESVSNKSIQRINKPINSHLQVERNNDELKVYIPAGGFGKLQQRIYGGCLSAFISYFLLALVGHLWFYYEPVRLPLLLVIIGGTLGWIFRFFGEKTYLSIGSKKFELVRKTLWFKYGKKWGNVNDIVGVFLNKNGGLNQVSIRSSYKTYYLGGALTEEECAWLAGEIQDWLREI
ncbi:MAG: serine/threonine protein kinase [Okeania sp. SIO2H7]|nr:serine/threonine protein kinase [Okeania sp. SIO2H7]